MLHSFFRVFAVFALLAAACSKEAPKAAPESRKTTHHDEVRAVLAAQQAAWNRHDLDAFLAGYRKDEHVVFTTPTESSRGFSELEQRYRKSYNSPEKFGELAFTDIACTTVDGDSVLVQGSWRLVRAKDSPHGRFVLIVCRFPEGWKIVSDFTTVDATGG
jgi:ketosteroid isomerase-like protein